jgi:hypothetical protein
MEINRKMLWIGLLLFATSFGLVELQENKFRTGSEPLWGFTCAYIALVAPLVERDVVLGMGFFTFVCLLIAGWINPVVLAIALLNILGVRGRSAFVLRNITLAMIPFSWVFAFYYMRDYPSENFFLWTIGIPLVLFSGKSQQSTLASGSLRKVTAAS